MRRHLLGDLPIGTSKDLDLFYITLYVSDKRIPEEMMLDTGSSVFWIKAEDCIDDYGNQFCGKQIAPVKYGYLDGALEGLMISTNVYLDSETKNKNVNVMLAQRMDSEVQDPIIGLANDTIGYQTFLDKLVENQVISQKIFGINLKDRKLFFGDKETENKIVYTPIISDMSYTIEIGKVFLYEEAFIKNTMPGLVDSGNTLIALPTEFSTMVINMFRGHNIECELVTETNVMFRYLVCTTANRDFFGPLSFRIAETDLILEGKDYMGDCVTNADLSLTCETLLEFHSLDLSIITGQPFMTKFITRFDLDNTRIGFEIPNSKVEVVVVSG